MPSFWNEWYGLCHFAGTFVIYPPHIIHLYYEQLEVMIYTLNTLYIKHYVEITRLACAGISHLEIYRNSPWCSSGAELRHIDLGNRSGSRLLLRLVIAVLSKAKRYCCGSDLSVKLRVKVELPYRSLKCCLLQNLCNIICLFAQTLGLCR